MNGVLIAAAVVGILGIVIGVFLGVSGAKFEVKVDERETLVREQLPGNNCGGCGYAGCDAYAKAIVESGAPINLCASCSAGNLEVISSIMGVEAEAAEKKVAYVKCSGDCDKAKTNYVYTGIEDCKIAAQMQGGGPKACSYGCLGYGSCKKACSYNAITIVNGLPVVDEEKCVGCGSCVVTCLSSLWHSARLERERLLSHVTHLRRVSLSWMSARWAVSAVRSARRSVRSVQSR